MDLFARAFYASDDSLVAENPVHMNLTDIVMEQVKRVLKHLGLYDSSLQKIIASSFLKDSFEHIDRAKGVLSRLGQNFRLGIISNNYGNLENICRETGLDSLMDVMVDSNAVGCIKPDPRIFEAGIKALKVDASSSMMVGDSHARDIKGALNCGMAAAWLVPAGRSGIAGPGQEEVPVIHGLQELHALLGIQVPAGS